MVNFLHDIRFRSDPLVLARLLPAAVLFAGVGLLAAGCTGGGRFAGGDGHAGGGPYGKPATQQPGPPDVEIPPLPQRQVQAQGPRTQFPGNWTPRAQDRRWQWIVIHHSATPDGGASRFDKEHRSQGWDELGYHFVIGNGSDTRDGLVEVGPRWTKQKHGAHAKTPDNRFNDYGIGVCLVGDFEIGRPSRQQMQSLANVVAYLMQRYNIPPERVIGHDQTGRSTACPGQHLENQLAAIRRAAVQIAARGQSSESRTALFAVEQP